MSPCDFVARHLESSSLLVGVTKLGAKVKVFSVCDDNARSASLAYEFNL